MSSRSELVDGGAASAALLPRQTAELERPCEWCAKPAQTVIVVTPRHEVAVRGRKVWTPALKAHVCAARAETLVSTPPRSKARSRRAMGQITIDDVLAGLP